MATPELTTTTVRYLFASEWAAHENSVGGMRVPGAKVRPLDTSANLLDIAVWSLREQGLAEVRQARPVEAERVITMGGKSFTNVVLDSKAELPGLEGGLLASRREAREATGLGRLAQAFGDALSPDDEGGLRGLILGLDLGSSAPWNSVRDYCRNEALSVGIIELKGRLAKKPVIADPKAIEALRPRNEEIAAAREAYRESEPELDEAVISDCVTTLTWAHNNAN